MTRIANFILAVAVLICGCTQFDESLQPESEKGTEHSICVNLPVQSEATKAYFESDGNAYKHYWETGDNLSVFPGTQTNTPYSLKSGEGTQSGIFSGTSSLGNGTFYAVYPYGEGNSLSSGTLTVEYPSLQTYRTDRSSYDRSSYLMVAKGDGNSLSFTNITSALRVSLTGSATITKIQVSSIGHETITGPATVTLSSEEPAVKLTGSEDVITLNALVELSSEVSHFYVTIPPVALKTGFKVTVFDNAGYAMSKTHTFNRTIPRNTVLEMPVFEYVATDKVSDVPVADMLDVVFLEDGSAKDISPMQMEITTYPGESLSTYFDYLRGQWVANYTHAQQTEFVTFGGGFYQVYYRDHPSFLSKLSDGHTIECYCKIGATPASTNVRSIPLGNWNSGGLGIGYNKGFQYQIHVGGSYCVVWADNTVPTLPEAGSLYHLVGVWDKTAGTATFYVNGENVSSAELGGTSISAVATSGDLHVEQNTQWLCIGGDSNYQDIYAETPWNGEIYSVRVYDNPLTSDDVAALYRSTQKTTSSTELVTAVSYLAEETVSSGYRYVVKGTGFAEGDVIRLRSSDKIYTCTTSVYDSGAAFMIPEELQSGIYNMEVLRSDSKQILGQVNLTMSEIPQADLLDVTFNADYTAQDNTSLQMTVNLYNKDGDIVTYPGWNNAYICRLKHVSHLNVEGADDSGFYHVPYYDNDLFLGGMALDFTMEVLCRASVFNYPSKNCYVFSSCNFDGTGIMSGANDRKIKLQHSAGTFYSSVATDMVWTVDQWYHIVAAWSAADKTVSIYVNGEHVKSVTNEQFAYEWTMARGGSDPQFAAGFVIGGDARGETGQADTTFDGDIACARIYDRSLTASEVSVLYQQTNPTAYPQEQELVINVDYLAEETVSEGYNYMVKGSGFATGDQLSLVSGGTAYDCTTSVYADGATMMIPANLASGSYDVVLTRGETVQNLGSVSLTMSDLPQADMLDVIFNKDYSAYDASAMQMGVDLRNADSDVLTYENPGNDSYMAQFSNTSGARTAETSGFYKVSYHTSDAFLNELADGHSLECLFMINALPTNSNNGYVFSSHDSGGSGLLCRKDAGYQICFAPSTGSTYNWTDSGITPETGRYYHVVGVWNKIDKTAHIYVNGELKNTVTTDDVFRHVYAWRGATEKFANFGIGGDNASESAGVEKLEFMMNGDVAVARIYDKPLSEDDAKALYDEAKKNSWPEDWTTATLQKSPASDELKVMSFNLRYKNGEASDSENYWDNRKAAAVALISDHRPTILGVQEPDVTQSEYLVEELETLGYVRFGVPAEVYTTYGFYDSNVVELIDYEDVRPYFWLSKSPDSAESSGSWGTAQNRAASWGIFRHKSTGKYFCYINTHLDHISQLARTEGLKVIMERFRLYNPLGYAQILTADFNIPAGNDAFDVVTSTMKNTRYAAPRSHSDLSTTWNSWGSVSNSIIDHIFCDNDMEVVEYNTITDSYRTDGGLYVSDHYPVYAIIKLK